MARTAQENPAIQNSEGSLPRARPGNHLVQRVRYEVSIEAAVGHRRLERKPGG